jgi:glycosyltransferase involved in cell wall biosynthesis
VVDARVPVHALNFAWHRLQWPPLEWIAGRFDVAHSLHPLLMPSRHAAQVITVHDLYFMDDPTGAAPEIRRDYAALASRHASRADAVIAVSEYTAGETHRRLGVPKERIVVCPSGAPDWEPRRPPAVAGPILFLGSSEPRKNVPGLLRAYALLRQRMPQAPSLVLAGRPPDPGSEAARMLAQAPWSTSARHLGYVTDGRRHELYSEASVLVLPSFDEGFGIPALEAMTIGLPVVASNRGALPEVIGDAGPLLDPEQTGAFAEAMEHVLTDHAYAELCVARGLERARRFTWAASASTLIRAYREAVARRQSGR